MCRATPWPILVVLRGTGTSGSSVPSRVFREGPEPVPRMERRVNMPNGRKRKRKKIATHKRKKRLRKNRHKKK